MRTFKNKNAGQLALFYGLKESDFEGSGEIKINEVRTRVEGLVVTPEILEQMEIHREFFNNFSKADKKRLSKKLTEEQYKSITSNDPVPDDTAQTPEKISNEPRHLVVTQPIEPVRSVPDNPTSARALEFSEDPTLTESVEKAEEDLTEAVEVVHTDEVVKVETDTSGELMNTSEVDLIPAPAPRPEFDLEEVVFDDQREAFPLGTPENVEQLITNVDRIVRTKIFGRGNVQSRIENMTKIETRAVNYMNEHFPDEAGSYLQEGTPAYRLSEYFGRMRDQVRTQTDVGSVGSSDFVPEYLVDEDAFTLPVPDGDRELLYTQLGVGVDTEGRSVNRYISYIDGRWIVNETAEVGSDDETDIGSEREVSYSEVTRMVRGYDARSYISHNDTVYTYDQDTNTFRRNSDFQGTSENEVTEWKIAEGKVQGSESQTVAPASSYIHERALRTYFGPNIEWNTKLLDGLRDPEFKQPEGVVLRESLALVEKYGTDILVPAVLYKSGEEVYKENEEILQLFFKLKGISQIPVAGVPLSALIGNGNSEGPTESKSRLTVAPKPKVSLDETWRNRRYLMGGPRQTNVSSQVQFQPTEKPRFRVETSVNKPIDLVISSPDECEPGFSL